MTVLASGSVSEEAYWKYGATPLDRVVRALSHPLRRQILRSLVHGPGSASTLSKKLGTTLGVISYHLNQVLAKECGVVDLVDTVARRGAVEKFYVLKFDDLLPAEPSDREKPEELQAMPLGECLIVAAAAMDTEAFETLPGSAWQWFSTAVDSAGWREICQARADFNERVEAAVKKSRARSRDHENLRAVVVGTAAFPR